MYSSVNSRWVLRRFQNCGKNEIIMRPQNMILWGLADESLTSLYFDTPFKNLSVVLCYLKILCKIHAVIEECKNSGMCFGSAGTVSSWHVVPFVHQIWFWWDRLSEPCTSLCQKQWSPSPLLFPFVLPSMGWLQYWFGLWESRFSSLNWLEINYFKKSIVVLPVWWPYFCKVFRWTSEEMNVSWTKS